ncbi:MAG: lactate racemase domain-containing protein [Gemmataceae bacterium]
MTNAAPPQTTQPEQSTALTLPMLAPIHQATRHSPLADVGGEVRRQWLEAPIKERFRPGMRVAVGVGSRGIRDILPITQATIAALRELGTQPFVVAAMGSHGGATAEGQRQLLAEYGIVESNLGVPVKTDMTAVRVGTNSWGEPVYWDKNAWEADAVVTVSRVKPHTDFRGRYESGIVKMLVIGLGKRDGAAQHHRWGVRGLRDMIPESCGIILQNTPFLAGLAVLENADEQTARVKVVDKFSLLDEEPGLLVQARDMMARLPFDRLDLLVIGEIGKNYSGAGIDPNVVGRLLMEGKDEFPTPNITRICALDLSPESHGNGVGIGIADLTTERFLEKIDPVPFRLNTLTSCFLWRAKLPLSFPNDRACIQMGLQTCWQPRIEELRMAVIANTLELSDLWASPALLAEAEGRNDLNVIGELADLPFDQAGNLEQARMFPHALCGRRSAATRH